MWNDEQRAIRCSCIYSRVKQKTRALWFSLNIHFHTPADPPAHTHTHQSRKWHTHSWPYTHFNLLNKMHPINPALTLRTYLISHAHTHTHRQTHTINHMSACANAPHLSFMGWKRHEWATFGSMQKCGISTVNWSEPRAASEWIHSACVNSLCFFCYSFPLVPQSYWAFKSSLNLGWLKVEQEQLEQRQNTIFMIDIL